MIGKIFLAILFILLLIAAAVLLFLRFWPAVGMLPGKADQAAYAARAPLFSDGRFHNENQVTTMTGKGYPASPRRRPENPIPAQTPRLLTAPQAEDLTFTWFGHSSFLLQLGGHNILVDPVLSDHSSPVSFAGPARFSELPMTAEELPGIDVVFISHDHYDHLDWQTIRTIRDKAGMFVVPLGVDAILRGWGVEAEKIRTLAWWETAELNGLRITLTPSQHFTGRNPLRGNSTLWGGMYLENGFHRVYYTGDGGYYGVFKAVRERLGAPELMIAECGQYDPAWAAIHMFPEQTAQAGLDAGADWLIPVHWGSFCICNHAWDDSIRRVTEAAAETGLRLATPQIGRTVSAADLPACGERWWEALS